MDWFLRSKCKTKENIRLNTNSIKNDTLEKVNTKAKNNEASPKPNVFEIDAFSFNLEYPNTTNIKNKIKSVLMISVVLNSSGNRLLYNKTPEQIAIIGNKNQYTNRSFISW